MREGGGTKAKKRNKQKKKQETKKTIELITESRNDKMSSTTKQADLSIHTSNKLEERREEESIRGNRDSLYQRP